MRLMIRDLMVGDFERCKSTTTMLGHMWDLNGSTPSEKAGIKAEGENRWLTLIQNASIRENSTRD
jgi:hypothetical protein